MQKKILSFILTVTLVFGAFLPSFAVLPKTQAQAEVASPYKQNANNSMVYVSTYEELRTAVKYATDNQTIMLQSDINEVSGHPMETYGDLEFTVDGTVVLDMNGCSIRLGSKNTATVFNITGKTKLHIINSRIDENDSDINFVPQNKLVAYNMLRSVICVNNDAAELYIHNGIHLILEENTNLTDSDSLVALLIYAIGRLEVMGEIESVPTIWAQPKGSDGIFFWGDPRDPDTFVNTSVFLRSGVISAHGNSVRADELSTSSFKEFKLATRLTAYGSDSNADRLYVDYGTDMTLADLSLTEGTFVAAGENLSASASVTKLMVNDCKDVYFYPAATCTHSSSENIPVLSYAGGHMDLCSCKTAYVTSSHNAGANKACLQCELTKMNLDPATAIVDEDVVEVGTLSELREALRSNKSNFTIRLTKDIEDASFSSASIRAEAITLAAYGTVVLDLNGFGLFVTTDNKPLFILQDNYCNTAGPTKLIIKNSASKMSYIVNMTAGIVMLDNSDCTFVLLDNVTLTTESTADANSAVIIAREFANLNIFGGAVKNGIGHAVAFDNSSYEPYRNSSVSISTADLISAESCISFGSFAFKTDSFASFRVGLSRFEILNNENIAVFECNNQSTVKWSHIIRTWNATQSYDLYDSKLNKMNKAVAVNGQKGTVQVLFGDASDCTEHNFEYFLSEADKHYGNCTLCGRTYTAEHTKVDSCTKGEVIVCDCGIMEKVVAHTIRPLSAKNPTCEQTGIKEGYYRCIVATCGKYFADAAGTTEVAKEDVIIPAKHTLNFVPAEGPEYPSCTDNCILAHYHCSKCERMFADESGTTELTEAEVYFTGEHDFEYFTNKYPTCEDYGVIEHKWCRNCNQYFAPDNSVGKQEDFFIAPNGHTFPLLHFTYKAETCVDGGHMEYYQCEECEKYFADAAAAEELTADEVFFPSLGGHTMVFVEKVEPSCTMAGAEEHYECSFCGLLAEDADATVELEESDIYIAPKGHMSQYRDAVAPDCVNPGNKEHYVCLNCGETFTDASCSTYIDAAIPALGHTPGTAVKENEVAPECETAGSYDSVTYCTVCNAEASRETIPVAPLYHPDDYISVENKVDATCTQAGSYDEVLRCTICHGELSCVSHTVPALAHNYVDGKCTNCGEKEYLPGDVDGNGKIESADARLALRAAVGLDTLTEEQTLAADVDGTPGLSSSDARLILRVSVGLESFS